MKHNLLNGQCITITDKMDGKMTGMWSLNTSAECNPFCQANRLTKGSICQHCYSKKTELRWEKARGAWTNNYNVLSSRLLTDREIPIINSAIFRLQAHGDLINRIHYLNLIKITEANPQTMFALWTKHLAVVNDGGIIKLKNLIHIYSAPTLNELKPQRPKGFDKVFVVYSRPFVREHKSIKVNCSASCLECGLCYERNHTKRINELIRQGGKH